MKGKYKKLITDINRGANIDSTIPEYVQSIYQQYNCYATVKMCMNYYTMLEEISELEDKNTDVCKYFNLVTGLIRRHIAGREPVDGKSLECITSLRSSVEYKMKVLTAYTDGYEIYEYILNRVEAGIKNTVEEVNPELLADKMFKYVFSENDTVVVNSKLQLLMAQLPVRMTKVKFYDIVANTLNIYEGGEKTSAREFADMLKTAVLISKPKGFETEYPYLYSVYSELESADYRTLSSDDFDALSDKIDKAAHIITNEVSAYMLLQEIINDVYTLLLTVDTAYEGNAGVSGYKSALTILERCINTDNPENVASDLMVEFMNIEGVQEDVYENIIILEAALDDIRQANSDTISKLGLTDKFDSLSVVSKLMSTSLFIDLDRDYTGVAGEVADHDYIISLRDELTEDFSKLFEGKTRAVVRSIMCKLLAAMPIFMNSQQEIQDYFHYVLNNCKDDSELTACNKLICEIIEEE